MMNQEGLIYIDKQYKSDMEAYEGIKSNCYKTIVENSPYKTLIGVWKG